MKYLIASDLHGSARYCRALLDTFRREEADRLILLGDLLYRGPVNPLPEEYDTHAVVAMLNEHADRILGVRGNCDAEVDQMVLQFPMFADYALLSLDGVDLIATHGHRWGPENPPPMRSGSYLLCGHIHLPVRRPMGHFTYLNPGSVSMPKEGTAHSCLLLEDGVFTWKDVVTGEILEPLA